MTTGATEIEKVPLPAQSGVTGQTAGTLVQAERPPITKLTMGEQLVGLANAHSGLFGAFGADTFAQLGRAYDEISRLRVENAVQKTELKYLRGNRLISKLLLLAGSSVIGWGAKNLDKPEIGWPMIIFGVAVSTAGWFLSPRGSAT